MPVKVAILGASRGLGAALAAHLRTLPNVELFLSARRPPAGELRASDRFYACDFTKAESRAELFEVLRGYAPHTIFCVAGGGPYGAYESKEFKDHLWAYELNLLFPARLLHFALNQVPSARRLIFVGSAIADNKPDEFAASYASAKHGLRGLVTTVRLEQNQRPPDQRVDVRLFSPGYIDTDLLPRNARPRQRCEVRSAEQVARELWQWSETPLE